MQLPISTDRLTIRRWKESDWKDQVEYTTDEGVAQYEFWDNTTWAKESKIVEWIRSQNTLEIPTLGIWVEFALELKDQGKVIGDVGIKYLSDENRTAEVGWTLNPRFQKEGFATEAATAFITACCESLKLHRITSRCDARNRDSYRLMERLGFRREAHHVKACFVKDKWCDEFVYAILNTEWHAATAPNQRIEPDRPDCSVCGGAP